MARPHAVDEKTEMLIVAGRAGGMSWKQLEDQFHVKVSTLRNIIQRRAPEGFDKLALQYNTTQDKLQNHILTAVAEVEQKKLEAMSDGAIKGLNASMGVVAKYLKMADDKLDARGSIQAASELARQCMAILRLLEERGKLPAGMQVFVDQRDQRVQVTVESVREVTRKVVPLLCEDCTAKVSNHFNAIIPRVTEEVIIDANFTTGVSPTA